MSGVVDEPPLRDERFLEAVEHVVEGLSQAGDLVGARDFYATTQVGLGDAARGARHFLHRIQDPIGHSPREQGTDQQDQ
jgi:hypothetical protein